MGQCYPEVQTRKIFHWNTTNQSFMKVYATLPTFGKYPGEGNGNPLQYSCLENSMDRAAWQATVHGVTNASEMTERSYSNLAKKKINHDQMASTPQRNVNSTWGF